MPKPFKKVREKNIFQRIVDRHMEAGTMPIIEPVLIGAGGLAIAITLIAANAWLVLLIPAVLLVAWGVGMMVLLVTTK